VVGNVGQRRILCQDKTGSSDAPPTIAESANAHFFSHPFLFT
jgi:hypothetical protein